MAYGFVELGKATSFVDGYKQETAESNCQWRKKHYQRQHKQILNTAHLSHSTILEDTDKYSTVWIQILQLNNIPEIELEKYMLVLTTTI